MNQMWMRRVVLSQARMVLVIREALAEWAIANGAQPDRVRVIPHGIDLERFDSIGQAEVEGDVIVFAGRLSRENYIYDVVQIAEAVPAATFVVIGDGAEMAGVRAAAPGNMLLLGFRSYEKVVGYRKAATVNLCLTGGFSLIEAAASGNPVVAYDVGWHRELIEDGVSGVLVEEGNVAQAVAAIVELLERWDKRMTLGARAREVVVARYSRQRASMIKARYYQELLDESST